MKSLILILLLVVVCAIAPARTRKRGKKAPVTKTMYDRLGQKKGIAELVDDFVANCAADTRINAFFAATAADPARLTQFKEHLVEQICQAADGPCQYRGKSMKEAHKGMGVHEEHFAALVEDLVKAMEKHKVKADDRDKLMSTLGPLKPEIVDSPT